MKKSGITTRDIVFIGVLSAVCVIATSLKIPFGNGAMVHLGSAAIYTIALIFGRKYAGFAGAIGSATFDIIMGFSPYTLWSFFIKGIAGFIVGSIAHSGGSKGQYLPKNLLALLVGAAWTLVGYLGAWTVIIGSFQAALLNIPSSLMSSTVGILVAVPLSLTLGRILAKSKIIRG